MKNWLSGHLHNGGRPVRGIIHAAGTVDDRLLVNMTEDDFTRVMAPKIKGARVLHNAFHGSDLEFFVMFGSAGSVITSPGQGNYAAANAVMDAFAHYRQAPVCRLSQSVGAHGQWGWSKNSSWKRSTRTGESSSSPLRRAPASSIDSSTRNSPTSSRSAPTGRRLAAPGLGGRVPPMFSELGTAETSSEAGDSESSILDFLSACPAADRLELVASHVQQVAAAVFEIAAADIGPDDGLDDIGMDSLMAMDFRLRVNAIFAIDLPLFELLAASA